MRASLWSSVAGFFMAPAAWALHQQVGYIVAPAFCKNSQIVIPVLTLAAVIVMLVGGFISWRSFHARPFGESEFAPTRRFVAALSLLFTALFLFAILMQGVAAFFLNGCER
jgi:hypothetical protein